MSLFEVSKRAGVKLALIAFMALMGLRSAYAAGEASPLDVESADGTKHHFTVELALNWEDQAKGLMYRKHLDPNKGMLFVFDEPDHLSFWMRNCLIPLDMLFIRANGTIANIVANAEPGTDTPRKSRGRAIAVLEIPGGRAAELGIKPGDIVRHPLLGTAEKN
ncbi:DUF192 domain-containing protein [Kordiimonas marina]|uniref:DUF192 domain-containing protein n=1 Tax=Kordiimonas marina TaxID=2872312 RepID=UPI001FF19526|nr:DUF192 domain-containing protein [Kordiimonas marina]MCJ9430206.1 DUF192 domain-containing protein [Kordiimonas marina]